MKKQTFSSVFTTSSILLTPLFIFLSVNAFAQQKTSKKMTPRQQAMEKMREIQSETQKDWHHMLDILNITLPKLPPTDKDPNRPADTFQKKGSNNWYDSQGHVYIRSAWGKWVNYDESKANPYSHLPNPLELENGQKITSVKTWWNKKRPEIEKDFSKEIYGEVPKDVPGVKWQVVSTKDTTIDKIQAVVKHVIGHVDNSSYPSISVNINVDVITPADADMGVPVIVHLGYVFPKGFKFPPASGKFLNPKHPNAPSWKVQLLRKGWGFAIYYPQSVQADNGAGLTRGIIGLTNKGQYRTPNQWGAIRAWAWGADRVMDYLQTDKNVNAKEVGIEGLSRFGKAALVIMAFDQRYAIGLIGSSGKGGAALFRRNYGESLGVLCSSGEYHWFAGNFIKYASKLNANDLRVDSNELFAMCAPRPVFVSCGNPKVEGPWVDDRGQFMAEAAASPVYEFLGKKGLGTNKMPPMGTALLSGDLAFRQHFGPHTDVPNWPYFIKFAMRYFKPVPLNK